MHTAIVAEWAVSLALQCSLLVILILRRRPLRLRLFTVLIAFYIARSVALFVLPPHMKPEPFAVMSSLLSVTDTILQLALVGAIAITAVRQYGDGRRDRLSGVLLLLLVGVLAAVFATVLLPSRGPAPIDRGSALVDFLMLLLWMWMAVERLGGPVRKVVEGFAAYGAVAITSSLIRNHAGLHRNAELFRVASWAQSCAYLLAVAFWCLTLRRADSAVAATEAERVRV